MSFNLDAGYGPEVRWSDENIVFIPFGRKLMSGLIIFAILAGVLIVWATGIYNSLVTKRVGTENAWSQIDVQLKRRHDLIPNLVETVKGYASHEKDTLEAVINARNNAVSVGSSSDIAERAQAEGMLTGALKQLFALSESYPDLKANENFAQLQEEITSTENRVSFARQHYNDSVGVFNTAIQKIPNNFVAGLGGFRTAEFFELDAGEKVAAKQAPQVSFS